jgi:anti-anti-sigma factor
MVNFETSGSQLRVTFSGKMDTKACLEMTPQIEKAVAASTSGVVFDLKGVDYVCSAFLRICLQAAKLKGADAFSLANVNPPVMLVLKTAGLDKLLKATSV